MGYCEAAQGQPSRNNCYLPLPSSESGANRTRLRTEGDHRRGGATLACSMIETYWHRPESAKQLEQPPPRCSLSSVGLMFRNG
jgi:hypothetical protein